MATPIEDLVGHGFSPEQVYAVRCLAAEMQPGALDAVRRAQGRRQRHPPRDHARGLAIKYRIDGVLNAHVAHGPALAEQVISRIKVMAELDIAERRVPQDGRFKVLDARPRVDFRVSIMPSIFGEDAVLRILDKQALADDGAGAALDASASTPTLDAAHAAPGARALRHAAGHRPDRQRQDHHAVRRDLRDQHTARTRSSPSRTRSSTSCPACCRSRSTRRRA
jgi:hypothetical protein